MSCQSLPSKKLKQAFVKIKRNQSILLSQGNSAKQPKVLLIHAPLNKRTRQWKITHADKTHQ
jgi:hypothetical protein